MKKKKRKDGQEIEASGQKKEQKIIYIDDGSTIADMSGGSPPRSKSTMREKMKTYFGVVKRMIVPLLCTLIAFTLVYIVLLAITGKL